MSNDNFADAIQLSSTPVDALVLPLIDTSSFTEEVGEPNVSYMQRTAWWKITPAQSGRLTVDTMLSESVGANTDTVIYIYTGSSLGSLTQIAYDDDGGNAVNSGTSRIGKLSVSAGTTYYIQVGKFGSHWGDYGIGLVLRYTLTLPPPLPLPPPEPFTDGQGTVYFYEEWDFTGPFGDHNTTVTHTPITGPAYQAVDDAFYNPLGGGWTWGWNDSYAHVDIENLLDDLDNKIIQIDVSVKAPYTAPGDISNIYFGLASYFQIFEETGAYSFLTVGLAHDNQPPSYGVSRYWSFGDYVSTWNTSPTTDLALSQINLYPNTPLGSSDQKVPFNSTDFNTHSLVIQSDRNTYLYLLNGYVIYSGSVADTGDVGRWTSLKLWFMRYSHATYGNAYVRSMKIRTIDGPVPDAAFWTDYVTTTETVAA